MSRPLKHIRVWRFGFYYVVVFGAYVGLALWLPKYYVDVYDFSLREAGFMTALFIFPRACCDRSAAGCPTSTARGAITAISFGGIGAGLRGALLHDERRRRSRSCCFLIGVSMGIGKASVYTYIPQYFPKDVGAVGGLVGAIGGLGGFVLPLLFAWAKGVTDRPESTFYVMTGLAVRQRRLPVHRRRAHPRRRPPRRDVIHMSSATWLTEWEPEDERVLDARAARRSRRAPSSSRPRTSWSRSPSGSSSARSSRAWGRPASTCRSPSSTGSSRCPGSPAARSG